MLCHGAGAILSPQATNLGESKPAHMPAELLRASVQRHGEGVMLSPQAKNLGAAVNGHGM